MVKIQQRVLLDFAKISPKWAEIYQTYRFGVMMNDKFCIDTLCKTKKNGLNLDIQDSIYCVLGEAYNFTDGTYNACEKCDDLSYQFVAHEKLDEAVAIKKFEQTIKTFVKHFKTVHPDLWADKVRYN